MKISKNLKRLRSEKGITQEQLAEMLFISRQSVSSWENDRTQPDIEMLGKLSEVFGVSLEELIYGKKRNTSLETEKPNYNTTLLLVFSILGSLLAGTGIILVFVYFWQQLPHLFKAVLSLLPLIAGQGAGVFVLIKKKDKIPWCEGAGVLWTAGIAATLAMVYNVFELGFNWESLLLIAGIMLIPVLFMLKCVAPVIIFYGSTIMWFFALASQGNIYIMLTVTILLLGIGCFFTAQRVKTEKKSIRAVYSHWISVFSVSIFFITLAFNLDGDFPLGVFSSGAIGLCLLLLSLKEPDIVMPYRLTGLMLSSLFLFATGAAYYGRLRRETENLVFVLALVFAVIIALAYILITKTKLKNFFLNAYLLAGIAVLIVYPAVLFLFPFERIGNDDEVFITVMKIIAIIANILLIISGGKEKRLLFINTGFISVAALTFLIVWQSDLSMLVNGCLLTLFGAALLIINYKLAGRTKNTPVPQTISKEVQENE